MTYPPGTTQTKEEGVHLKSNRWRLSLVLLVVAAGAAVIAAKRPRSVPRSIGPSGKMTVWVDAVRVPVAKLYKKTHPKVKLNIVIYDGDGNGATTMQTKIQLWNRTGHGWPDIIFTEQANDPVWMSQKPFDFALTSRRSSRRASLPAGLHRHSHNAPSRVASSASRTTWPRRSSTSTRS